MKRVVASYCSSSDMLATLLLSLYVFWEMAEVRSFVLARNLPLRDLTPFRFRVEESLLGLGGVWFVRRHSTILTVSS
jgi:hypothetical protein